jgi:hydroxyacylglutathione hydrolase
MGGFLADHATELRETRDPIALVCGGGYRSTVAASVLERAGVSPVFNVTGGMTAWKAAGLPVVS